jgi:transcriptional regulator with XRE-family HTH domain
MLEQAEALKIPTSVISSIETGERLPDFQYLSGFAKWLDLPVRQQADLQKIVERRDNVILFPRSKPNQSSTTVRFFRKLSKMGPNQIRKLKPPKEREYLK